MIETDNKDIDVDEIMAKIKAEVANRNSGGRTNSIDDPFADEMLSSFDRHHLKINIGIAEENSVIGKGEFSMLRFNRMIRWFAKLASRIVLYLTRIITFPQTNFNLAILNVIHIFRDGLVNLEKRLNHHEHNVSQLLEQVQEQKEKLAIQEQINSYLQSGIAIYESRLAVFLEEARKRLPEPFSTDQIEGFSAETDHLFDPLYLAFEDRFRGNRQEIKERLQVYLPWIEESGAGTEDAPILDIGCGRGEWLEFIAENRRTIVGVDLNRTLVEQCEKRGMNVIEMDAIAYLRSLAENSAGAVTAFHLIEHLPLNVLLNFLNESLRVLRKNGVIILETPNPENVLVGSCNFYYDPTHRNPLPPQMVKFLLESRGFYRVHIERLHPYPDEARIPDDGSEVVERFNQRFYGPQDYAVIGYKL
ncbi:MAG: class I SAM-dependent methyltransferase [Pseudomonadota bacterium]